MIYFYDTNVIIEYIYSLDPLNKLSKKAIINKHNRYYSEHVKIEVNKVSRRKNRQYYKFFKKISKIIDKTDDNSLVSLSFIHSRITGFEAVGKLDRENMHEAVDLIWDELGFDENTDAFKVKKQVQ